MDNRRGGVEGGHEGEGGRGAEEKDLTSGIWRMDLPEKGTETEGKTNIVEVSPEQPKADRKAEESSKSVANGSVPKPRGEVVIFEKKGSGAIMRDVSSKSKEEGNKIQGLIRKRTKMKTRNIKETGESVWLQQTEIL
ncbi:hypothetical protein L6452_41364 [Arctium lappa]|uniref:Uncharacterized protein n=1 Tax=Arctium lappa TaxID=4217 RepID=A0ACB8XPB2_ARCLA|nr:hypothetical protein L6452_41364 [Arctium lappa]